MAAEEPARGDQTVPEILNEFGRQGWEMAKYQAISMTSTYLDHVKRYAYPCFFKRPVK